MYPIYRLTCFLLFAVTLTQFARGQNGNSGWEKLERIPERRTPSKARVQPEKFKVLKLHGAAMRELLKRAPKEVPGQIREDHAEIALPMPDGSFARFKYVESPVMEPDLAAKFPQIKTYMGQGIDDPSATVRFDLTPNGFHAQIFSPKGAVYIDPPYGDDSEVHVSYYKKDYLRKADGFACLVPPPEEALVQKAAEVASRSGSVLRTYRLACAATGEYTAFHGGTVASGMAAIVTAINRVNQVYEAELSVRLVLVANNHLLVFTNGGTDPYTNDEGGSMLSENQDAVDAIIGSANYDIGHVFSTGGGGIAYLRSVCNSSLKAGGVTGLDEPTGDPFYIDYVAHEIGHQFGGNHTFNSQLGSCSGGNRNGTTAYEPGSGSTIQAYAGICTTDNLQLFSDPYFHSISFDEITAFVTGTANSCSSQTSTGNGAPVVSAGPNYAIPKGTPFTLTATGSDPNGDLLTYCWEQRDLGAAQSLSDGDNGTSPLFRSFQPTVSPSRTFPKLSSILANTTSVGEKLPAVSRTMKFRVTARDNRSGGGGVNTSDMQVTVAGSTGPFIVTAPNTAVTWSNSQMVAWNVAGTTGSPVNCSTVNILLSTNGGASFSVVLATNTPNDGSEFVNLPSVATSAARIKIEGNGNIFFDISDANFTLVPAKPEPSILVDSHTLLGESFAPGNGAVDPNETVQLSLSLKNMGTLSAENVLVTLLADSAVAAPSAAQSYGTLLTNDLSSLKTFSFTAKGVCGDNLPARFEVRTNGVFHSLVTLSVRLGGTVTTTQTRNNAAPIALPGSGNIGNAAPYPSRIVVSNLVGRIQKVSVNLIGLTHAQPDNIDILLVGPQGQSVLLMSDAGGTANVGPVFLTFDDSGSILPASGLQNGAVYRPGNLGASADSFASPAPGGPYGSVLAVFTNTNPNGTWSLYAVDDTNKDRGDITGGWKLNFVLETPVCHTENTFPAITLTRGGNQLNLQWTVEAGKLYRVQMKNDLNDQDWTTVQDVAPTGTIATFSPSIENGQKFFRVIALN